MGQPMDIKTLVEELKRQGRTLMLPGMTDRSKLGVDEQGLATLLEMAYRKQVAMRRVTYVPNTLTSEAITKLAHFLTDNHDNRFMIVLDGSTATGKTTLMNAMRQTLWWLLENRLVSDEVSLKICDATAIPGLRDSTREWYNLMNWPSYLGIEDLGCEPAEILRWGNPLYPVRELITERYKLRLPMVVSTNLDSDQLREHLGLRIVSRMNEMAYYIHFENEDFRKMHDCIHELDENTRLYFPCGSLGAYGCFGSKDGKRKSYLG